MSSLSRLTCQASGLPSQEQGVKYVVNSDILWGTNVYPSDLHQRGRFSTLLLIDPAYQNTKVVKIGFDTV